MPLVRWPEKPHHRRLLVGFISAVVIVGMLAVTFQIYRPQTASAATIQLPDPRLDLDPMKLVVSVSNVPGVINAPKDYVKIYFDRNAAGTRSINLWNAPFNPCGTTEVDPDWYSPTLPAGQCSGLPRYPTGSMAYDFFAMDANESAPPAAPLSASTYLFTVDGQTGAESGPFAIGPVALRVSNWSGNIQIPMGPTAISNLTDFRVVVMRARFVATPTPVPPDTPVAEAIKLHSYQIRTVNGADQLGYWEGMPGSPPSDGQYILHYQGNPSQYNVDSTKDEIDFAPPCNMPGDTPTALKWFDADNSDDGGGDGTHGPWDNPPFFIFQQIDAAGNVVSNTRIDGRSRPHLGGNNEYDEMGFTAHIGWKYRWIWEALNGPTSTNGGQTFGAANNIQMWIPFDSINYSIQCWNYQSTINNDVPSGTIRGGPDAGHPVTLDFSNPANYTNMTYDVNIMNVLNQKGPNVFVRPTFTLVSGVASCITGFSDTWGPPLTTPIHGPLNGFQTVNNAGQFSCSINPTTAQTNSVFCFGDQIMPHTPNDAAWTNNNPPNQCYKVLNNRRHPSVQAHGSDVHAGGGICNLPAAPQPNPVEGNISSTGVKGDVGDYVVSAAGLVTDFPSNGGAGGGSALTLGANGDYADVCRPDIYKYATTHMNGVPWTPGPATIALGTVPAATDVIFVAGDATVHGTFDHKITIVASGNIIIVPPGTAAAGASGARNQVPVLGLVAHQNIMIDKAVTSVAGALFSDQTIDTCSTAVFPPPAPQCQNTLTVYGFLMAQGLSLKRMGPFNSVGAQIGENVTFDPSMYLNPPPYFDSAVSGSTLQSLGERQPFN